MQQKEWIKCPLCGWHWKREHTGKHKLEHHLGGLGKGKFTFDKVNMENDSFISIRNLPGGRGNPESFKEIKKITLEEAKDLPEYQDLITSLRDKCQEILEILRENEK